MKAKLKLENPYCKAKQSNNTPMEAEGGEKV
jgi:hypothetical protein